MIYELRIYNCDARQDAGAAATVREVHARYLEEARHPPGRILDDDDRRVEPATAPTCSPGSRSRSVTKIWIAFAGDPQWLAVRAETERDGPLVDSFSNQILKPTAFSAVK